MPWTVGVDEVGRGALAGPVVVAVVALPTGFRAKNANLGILKDSKKLSAKKREAWCEYFKSQPGLRYALARVYPRQIERRNVSRAANIAAGRAFLRLRKDVRGTGVITHKTTVFLDGGLFLGSGGHGYRHGGNQRQQPAGITTKTIIKGDEKIPAIAAASIVAKVYRDRLMVRLGKKYPAYGFAVHKGYGTAAHRAAIRKHGPIAAHRLTFLKKSLIMEPQSHGRRTGKTS